MRMAKIDVNDDEDCLFAEPPCPFEKTLKGCGRKGSYRDIGDRYVAQDPSASKFVKRNETLLPELA